MNNRIGMAVVGIIAAVALIFAIVQSGNLSQTETKLAAVQSTATAQQVAFANQGTAAVATLSAASTQAADSANTLATAQANALTDAQNAAATSQANALADAAKAASTLQAQALAAASQAAATAQAKVLTDAQNMAATAQSKALATAQAQSTATLSAVVEAAATSQADALQDAHNAASTAQGKAIATVQAQAGSTLGAVVAQAATDAAATEQNYVATQRAMTTQIAQANNAVATAQANAPTNAINPTAVPTTESAAVPKGWKRYVGKGVAIQLPNTYIGSELGTDPEALGQMLRALGPDFESAALMFEQNPDILAFIAVNVAGDVSSNVIVISVDFPANIPLDTLLDLTIAQLPSATRILERELVEIGGYEAGRMVAETTVDFANTLQLQYYIVQDKILYLVGFTTTLDDFDSQVEAFEASMKTFEILGKPGI